MRNLIEALLLILLVAWVGILLLVHGMQQGHAVLTVVGVGCCGVAVATYFVLSDGRAASEIDPVEHPRSSRF